MFCFPKAYQWIGFATHINIHFSLVTKLSLGQNCNEQTGIFSALSFSHEQWSETRQHGLKDQWRFILFLSGKQYLVRLHGKRDLPNHIAEREIEVWTKTWQKERSTDINQTWWHCRKHREDNSQESLQFQIKVIRCIRFKWFGTTRLIAR